MNALQNLWKREGTKALSAPSPKQEFSEGQERIYQLPTASISPNRGQPREQFDQGALVRLADSIRRFGILQPLTVRAGETPDTYELIAGERRLRAALLLKLPTVPCRLMEADSRLSAELAMVENLQRENLNMFEQANAIRTLMETYGLTQEQIALRLSSSQSAVANKLRLLRFSPEEREVILTGGLTERHARAVLRLTSAEIRLRALEHISACSMTVSASEEYVERLLTAVRTEPVRQMEYKLLRRDVRLFHNTVDRAVDTLRRAGIPAECSRREIDGGTETLIRIRRAYKE